MHVHEHEAAMLFTLYTWQLHSAGKMTHLWLVVSLKKTKYYSNENISNFGKAGTLVYVYRHFVWDIWISDNSISIKLDTQTVNVIKTRDDNITTQSLKIQFCANGWTIRNTNALAFKKLLKMSFYYSDTLQKLIS